MLDELTLAVEVTKRGDACLITTHRRGVFCFRHWAEEVGVSAGAAVPQTKVLQHALTFLRERADAGMRARWPVKVSGAYLDERVFRTGIGKNEKRRGYRGCQACHRLRMPQYLTQSRAEPDAYSIRDREDWQSKPAHKR